MSSRGRVAVGAAAVLLIAAAAIYRTERFQGEPTPLPWQDLTATIGPLELARPLAVTLRTRGELQRLTSAHVPGRAPALPAIDFRRRVAVLVSAGPRSATGYAVEVVRVSSDDGRVRVVVRERTPSLGEPVTPRVTYPYRLITVPTRADRVAVVWLGRP